MLFSQNQHSGGDRHFGKDQSPPLNTAPSATRIEPGPLFKLKQELDEIVSESKKRPAEGREAELEIRQRQLDNELKTTVIDWSKRASDEAMTVSLANYLVEITELERTAPEIYKLKLILERQVVAITTIIDKLK